MDLNILERIVNYLDEHSNFFMLLVTAIYVIATILIYRANAKSNKLADKQLEEARKQYDEQNRPYIEVELIYERRQYWGFRFINNGRFTAQSVKINLDKAFINSLEQTFSKMLKEQIGREIIIGAGQHYDLYFGTNEFRNNEDIGVAKGSICYSGKDKNYKSDFCVDVASYATIFSVESYEELIIKKLDKRLAKLNDIEEAIRELKN